MVSMNSLWSLPAGTMFPPCCNPVGVSPSTSVIRHVRGQRCAPGSNPVDQGEDQCAKARVRGTMDQSQVVEYEQSGLVKCTLTAGCIAATKVMSMSLLLAR